MIQTGLHRAFVMVVLFAVLTGGAAVGQLLGAPGATAPAPGGGPTLTYAVAPVQPQLHRGATGQYVLDFQLAPGWHVNAHKPLEEFLIGTEVKLEGVPGVTPVRVQYPEHELFEFEFSPDQPVAVYPERFSVGVVVETAADVAPGEYTLKGSLRYQACNDQQCAPPRTVELELPVMIAGAEGPEAGADAATAGRVNWTDDANAELLGAADAEGAAPEEGGVVEPAASGTPPAGAGDWRSLAEDFQVTNRTAYTDTAGFLRFIEDAEAGTGSATGNTLAGQGMVWIVLGILGGGLLLNLTPCVLPLIPINIAIIGAGARAGSRTRGFLLGGAYGVGIALTYGALGLVVVLGLSNAFGVLNSTLWFNLLIAAVFVLMALAMFDIITVDFSRFQAKFGIRKNENGSFFIALGMGALSALLAGACVAPAVIATLALAQDQYAKGVQAAVLLPFLLGLGMALPWPFAGAGLSFLPKPGAWMNRVKYLMGLFMVALAGWYVYTAWHIYENRPQALTAEEQQALEASLAEADQHGWMHSLDEGLAQAKAENKPVLLDFWATWCKNCLVMNETVLEEEEVLQAMEGYVKIKYQAEDPSASPVKEVWEYYDLKGLPTYLILEAK